jgi:hypothetical protein
MPVDPLSLGLVSRLPINTPRVTQAIPSTAGGCRARQGGCGQARVHRSGRGAAAPRSYCNAAGALAARSGRRPQRRGNGTETTGSEREVLLTIKK